jgi:uncharacterized protein YjiS (DUF1127 family)
MLMRLEQLHFQTSFLHKRRSPLAFLIALDGAWRQRKALSELEGHNLQDIAITREAVRNESKRPFWSVPTVWTQ